MTDRLDRFELALRGELVAPPLQRSCEDRSFELPTGLYLTMAGLFLAFIAVTTIGFAAPELAVPAGVFVAFIAAFFTVPALWVGMKPDNATKPLDWKRFLRQGVDTATGHCEPAEAAIQMLILPTLILLWGIAVVVIASLV